MKIGILTHSLATNYGANLQSLSTAYYLKKHGFDPFFFNWNSYLEEVNSKMNPSQVKMHTSILQRHGFKVSEPCVSSEDFRRVINDYGIRNIIVGSDAVLTVKSLFESIKVGKRGLTWGHIQADYQFPNPFWLDFIDENSNIKAFLMSPSCQSSRYGLLSKKTKRWMADQLNLFSFLSARDYYTQKMICDIAHLPISSVPVTPDPVWNFNENADKVIPSKTDLLKKYNIDEENYILVSFYPEFIKNKYFLTDMIERAKVRGYKTYFLPMPQDNNYQLVDMIPLPVDSVDYFSLIKYSKGYIGNNMHPVITAIHNHVPFVSIDQHGKWYFHGHVQVASSSKVLDLLSRFEFTGNRINQIDLGKYTPDMLLDILEATDKDKLCKMSRIMQVQYIEMMSKITERFV